MARRPNLHHIDCLLCAQLSYDWNGGVQFWHPLNCPGKVWTKIHFVCMFRFILKCKWSNNGLYILWWFRVKHFLYINLTFYLNDTNVLCGFSYFIKNFAMHTTWIMFASTRTKFGRMYLHYFNLSCTLVHGELFRYGIWNICCYFLIQSPVYCYINVHMCVDVCVKKWQINWNQDPWERK